MRCWWYSWPTCTTCSLGIDQGTGFLSPWISGQYVCRRLIFCRETWSTRRLRDVQPCARTPSLFGSATCSSWTLRTRRGLCRQECSFRCRVSFETTLCTWNKLWPIPLTIAGRHTPTGISTERQGCFSPSYLLPILTTAFGKLVRSKTRPF